MNNNNLIILIDFSRLDIFKMNLEFQLKVFEIVNLIKEKLKNINYNRNVLTIVS